MAIKDAISSYRVLRLVEEIKKRDHKVDLLCSSEASIFTDKVISGDAKEIDFNDYDYVYSLGNDEKHQYLLTLAKYTSKTKVWPNDYLINDKFIEGVF